MKKTAMIMTLAVVVIFSSCSTYEEGPGLSLRSKQGRLTNTWVVDYAVELASDTEITADFSGTAWEFEGDGTFTEYDEGSVDQTGSWEFASDKEQLQITFPDDQDTFTILRLKSSELWLTDNEVEIRFVPQ